MGLIDRLGKIAKGVGEAIEAPFGLIADIATAPWNDDEDYNGFLNTLTSRGASRGGQFLGGLFSPNTGVGAAIGAIPEEIRNPIRGVASPVGRGLETAYREGVGEPLSTVWTAASLADSRGKAQRRSELSVIFDPDTWKTAYKAAQHRSPGQAFALGLSGINVEDRKAVEAAVHSDGFKILSGVSDAIVRFTLDPTVVGGKAASAVRMAKIVKPITAKTDFDKVEASSRFGRVVQAMDGMDAAAIRHQFFPNNVHGAVIATTLADAGDAATRAKALRLFMGDLDAADALRAERADIAGQVERLTGQQTVLDSLDDDAFTRRNLASNQLDEDAGAAAAVTTELDRTQAEIELLIGKDVLLARRQAAVNSITAEPRVGVVDLARTRITRSETFQKHTLAAPLRRAVTMRPHNIIDLNRPEGDSQIQRLAKQIGFSPEDQDAWRNEYMRAWSPTTRANVVTRMEEAGIELLAKQAGMTAAEITATIRKASEGRGQATEILKSRVYDGEGRSRFSYKDDDGLTHEVPLLMSQNANTLPLTDFHAAKQALKRVGEFKARHPNAEVPGELLETFYRIWKPSVLLRVGWPIRVVGDEQMRILAKIGALAQMRNFAQGVGNTGHNMVEKALAQVEGRAPELKGVGFEKVKKGQYELPSAYGDKSAPNQYYGLSSSQGTFENAFETVEQTHLRQIRGASADHRSITPEEASHSPAWLDALNNQIGKDPLGQLFLRGGSVSDGVKWLRSAEGRKYAAEAVPELRRDLTLWAGRVKEQVDSYTLGNPILREKAITSKVTADDLFAVAPDAAQRPIVHGAVLAEAFGQGFTAKHVQPLVQKAYRALGSVPTDTLSRHPFFDAMYRAEISRRVDLADAQASKQGRSLTAEELDDIAKGGREYALSETRRLLYDLQEQSDLAHTLRFLMPFYSAWQETTTRWAGLFVENPAFIARMRLVWNAPEKAGLITDENGNPVGWGEGKGTTKTVWTGTYDKQGNKVMQEVTVGKERYVTLPVPKWAQEEFKGLRGTGQVRFNKKSANLVLQGAPGFGPAVQVPVNEIVKERPELADSLKHVLPFGAQQSTMGALLPATVKRLSARAAGEEDRSFHNAAMRLYFDQVTDYNLGKRDDRPTWEGAIKQARSFYNIRAVASYISPVAPGFQSPYQPYIDAYRRLRAADPENADMRFLDMYGQEYFALTQSLSKSMDGVPPTVEAFAARSKYKALIEKHPDLGGLIIGAEGAGEFSNSVYQAQLASRVAPGSSNKQRETLPFEVASTQPEVRLGWIEYTRAMDMIETAQHARGLPNLRVKGAQDLAMLKRAITNKLMYAEDGETLTPWGEQFNKQDRGAMKKRLQGLRELAADDRLAQRPEFRGLRDYMEARSAFYALLQARESKTLDSTANVDLAEAWETVTFALAERNPAWSQMWHRYLDRDNLEVA